MKFPEKLLNDLKNNALKNTASLQRLQSGNFYFWGEFIKGIFYLYITTLA